MYGIEVEKEARITELQQEIWINKYCISAITALANNEKNGGERAEKADAILNQMETIADKE
eukprot:4129597-Ditylum_brightwellii.AAC.1